MMSDNHFSSIDYVKIDFTQGSIEKGEYDNCTFVNCNFQSAQVSSIQFIECQFTDCNFSNAIIKDSSFIKVYFAGCKMIGVKFHEANQFLLQFSFKECQLNFSSFYKLKIPNTSFISCNLEHVDFTETQASKNYF